MAELNERLSKAEAELGATGQLAQDRLVEREALQARLAIAEQAQGDLKLRESELRQRQEEMRDELEQVRRNAEVETDGRQRAERKLAELTQLHAQEELLALELKEQLAAAKAQGLQIERQLAAAEERGRDLERRLKSHFSETGTLSKMLLEREENARKEAVKVQRLREILQALARRPRLSGLLPRSHQRRQQNERLKRLGLFDGARYLRMNPDVADSGMDPLEHFVLHGIDEDRSH